jgi:hypothetical protein
MKYMLEIIESENLEAAQFDDLSLVISKSYWQNYRQQKMHNQWAVHYKFIVWDVALNSIQLVIADSCGSIKI